MENQIECQGVPGVVPGTPRLKLVPLLFAED